MKNDPALNPELFVENPAKPEDFKDFSREDLEKGLAYWINLANFRGNNLIGLHHENKEMKKDFFKLRKDAFLSRLDRWEVMVTAVKHVGNQPNGND